MGDFSKSANFKHRFKNFFKRMYMIFLFQNE